MSSPHFLSEKPRVTLGKKILSCSFCLPPQLLLQSLLSEFSDLRVFLLKINPITVFSVKQSLSAITGLIILYFYFVPPSGLAFHSSHMFIFSEEANWFFLPETTLSAFSYHFLKIATLFCFPQYSGPLLKAG